VGMDDTVEARFAAPWQAAFSSAEVNDHALAVDIADLQVC